MCLQAKPITCYPTRSHHQLRRQVSVASKMTVLTTIVIFVVVITISFLNIQLKSSSQYQQHKAAAMHLGLDDVTRV